MKEHLLRQFQLIAARYEKIGVQSADYDWIKNAMQDDSQMEEMANVLACIENGDKLFNISKQINAQKNDQRLSEAFAEFDTAKNLVTTKFYGDFTRVAYQPPRKDKRWPDFIADNMPVEVKLLMPQEHVASKFFQKLIDKVNKHALPQLQGYYQDHPFDKGLIFIRSNPGIPLGDIDYYDLRAWFESKVPPQAFAVTVL